jgi:hypothetical protein
MQLAYSALALCLFLGSAVLGFFFVGSAGLAAGAQSTAFAFIAWGVGCLASGAGLVSAVRRLSLPTLFALCLVPFGLALLVSNLALRFGQ